MKYTMLQVSAQDVYRAVVSARHSDCVTSLHTAFISY